MKTKENKTSVLVLAADAQAVQGTGQIGLSQTVFHLAALLQQLLPGAGLRLLGAVGVDVLRAFGGVHQNQDGVVLYLDQAGGDRCPVGHAVRGAEDKLSGDKGGDDIGPECPAAPPVWLR